MTPPSQTIPSTPTVPTTPTPPEAPNPARTPETSSAPTPTITPRFNHLEINAGVRYGIGDSFQLELGLAYRPTREIYLGVLGQFAPTSRGGLTLQAGYRVPITDILSIQPTLFGGFNYMDRYSRTVGSLQESINLTGVNLFVGLEARFMIQATNWLGIYLAPGLMIQGPVGVSSTPSQLHSMENPVGGVDVIPTISLGLSFGTVESRSTPVETETPRPRPTETTPRAATPPAPNFEERVRASVAQVTEGMERERAARIEQVIGEVRDRITRARASVGHLNNGINETNRMAWLFAQTTDRFSSDAAATLSAEDRSSLQRQLESLLTATEMNATHEPVSTSDASEDLRTGLRFISSTTTARYPFGRAVLNQLTALRDQLRGHNESELAGRTDQTITRLTDSLNAHPEGIRAADLQREVESIEQSMGLVQSLESDYHLETNETWRNLRDQLTQVQDEVSRTVRTADALGNFAFLLQGTSNSFGNQVRTPSDAQDNLQEAIRFLETMSGTTRFRGVTVEDLRSRYGFYLGFLSYNLNRFIELHTPPAMTNEAERRNWFTAAGRARDLLCRINPEHARCHETLETPPAAVTGRGRRRSGSTRTDHGSGSGSSTAIAPRPGRTGRGTGSSSDGSATSTTPLIPPPPPPPPPAAGSGETGTSSGSSPSSHRGSGRDGGSSALPPPPPPPPPAP